MGGRSGFVAGAVGAVVTSPIDAIKTRMQVETGVAGAGGGVVGRTVEMVKSEGVGCLTRGIGARVLWIAPGSALTIAFFELFQKELVAA